MTTTQREHYRLEYLKARRRAERCEWARDIAGTMIANAEAHKFRRLLEGGTA